MKNLDNYFRSSFCSLFVILFSFYKGNIGFSQIDTTTYKTLTDSVFVVGDRILVRDI